MRIHDLNLAAIGTRSGWDPPAYDDDPLDTLAPCSRCGGQPDTSRRFAAGLTVGIRISCCGHTTRWYDWSEEGQWKAANQWNDDLAEEISHET